MGEKGIESPVAGTGTGAAPGMTVSPSLPGGLGGLAGATATGPTAAPVLKPGGLPGLPDVTAQTYRDPASDLLSKTE
jgi:hypothetical protein